MTGKIHVTRDFLARNKLSEPLDPSLVVMGRASTYEGILACLNMRRKQLGLSMLMLDEIAGLASGHSGKLLGGAHVKGLGPLSFTLLLGALRLDLLAIAASGDSAKPPGDYFVERARKGARVLNARLTARQRRLNGRKGGEARWKKWRLAKAEKVKREAREARKAEMAARTEAPTRP
jgi:hypothetical protein